MAYLQIPKAACSSIQAALLSAEDPEAFLNLEKSSASFVTALHHTPGLFKTTSKASGYLRFTFVRHPFDRLVSFYRNQVSPQKKLDARAKSMLQEELAASAFWLGMGFGEFVQTVLTNELARNNRHVRPQSELIISDGGLAVDYLGRVEEIEEGWHQLGRWTGGNLPPLYRFNVTGGASWNHCGELTPELVEHLALHYQDDLRLLGYSAAAL